MFLPSMWAEGQINEMRQHQYHQQQLNFDGLHHNHHQPSWGREDTSNFITPENSLLSYDSPANSGMSHFFINVISFWIIRVGWKPISLTLLCSFTQLLCTRISWKWSFDWRRAIDVVRVARFVYIADIIN